MVTEPRAGYVIALTLVVCSTGCATMEGAPTPRDVDAAVAQGMRTLQSCEKRITATRLDRRISTPPVWLRVAAAHTRSRRRQGPAQP